MYQLANQPAAMLSVSFLAWQISAECLQTQSQSSEPFLTHSLFFSMLAIVSTQTSKNNFPGRPPRLVPLQSPRADGYNNYLLHHRAFHLCPVRWWHVLSAANTHMEYFQSFWILQSYGADVYESGACYIYILSCVPDILVFIWWIP